MKRQRCSFDNDSCHDDETDTKPRAVVRHSMDATIDQKEKGSFADNTQKSNSKLNSDDKVNHASSSTSVTTSRRIGTAHSENREGCLQTPHTMRLLKLIREGSKEYATMAVERLSFYCTTISPIQLWDLLGRLQAFLSAPEWSTRQIASQAIYVVAHHLPLADQYNFLAKAPIIGYDDIPSDVDARCTTADRSNEDNLHEFLTVQDLLQESRFGHGSGIDTVLAEGRELFALHESRYDGSDVGQGGLSSAPTDDVTCASVADRVRQQRRILASRLGLSVLSDVVGDEDNNSMIPVITNDDVQIVSSTCNEIRQKHARRIQEVTSQRKSNEQCTAGKNSEASAGIGMSHDLEVQDALDTEPQNPHSIRALLVREISKQQATPEIAKPNCSSGSHRNPQMLLANELLYRMFDPIWYIRHGAVLGILALLRAWTKSYRSFGKSISDNSICGSELFGIWPQDLLVRCLCVLGLDRFGDFAGGSVDRNSGTANGSDDIVDNNNSGITHTLMLLWSGVVAPVREVCGQTVAVLHSMAPYNIAEHTRQVLFKLCRFENSWEVRHGALIALKYIVIVETRGLLQEQNSVLDSNYTLNQGKKSFSRNELIKSIGQAAIERLADFNDDVKSEAAHVLTEMCSGNIDEGNRRNVETTKLLDFMVCVVPPLWDALQSVRYLSSCIVDLVALLTVFVNLNCGVVLKSMSRSPFSDHNVIPSRPTNSMIQFLVNLLDSDFTSVRVSSLHSIGVLVAELSSTQSPDQWDDESLQMISKTLQEVAIHILHLFRPVSDTEFGSEKYPKHVLEGTWSHISDACIKLLKKSDLAVMNAKLLSWFFDVDEEGEQEETNFSARVQSANALAYHLSDSTKSSDVTDLTQAALLVFLGSPSPSQCESACLLYRALAPRLVHRSSLEAFERILDPNMLLPCLSSSLRNVRDDYAFSVAAVRDEAKCPSAEDDILAEFWTKLFQVNQRSDVMLRNGTMCPVISMRVSATLAGAVLVKGVPSKLTPLVRILITFFNNESVSRSRAELVAEYFTDLLVFLVSNPKFERAFRKILDSVCDAVTYRSCGGQLNEFRKVFASTILRSFFRKLSLMESLRNFPSFWLRLQPITKSNEIIDDGSGAILDAIDLLEVFIEELTVEHSVFRELVDLCTPCLMALAFTSACLVTRDRAVSSIVSLLGISSINVLQVVVPLLKHELQSRSEVHRRFSACKILKQLVEASGTEFCIFIRIILPLVLSLMTDSLVECAQCATATFALLIKVAPLVRQKPLENRIIGEDHHESVIDHLIFGKPLPPYDLPEELSNSLREKNIILRDYQKEGITWLRFLNSVNLSGALCDDMGTGKSIQALVAIALAHFGCRSRFNRTSDTSEKADQHFPLRSMIICPSTLVGHWDGEIAKFFPPRTIFTSLCLTGTRSDRIEKWIHKSVDVNIVIASYDVLRSDIDYLDGEEWCYCVLDEGHLLKNPKTATALASKRLRAQHKLVLTGTLIQNRIHELWATFDFLMPGFLGISKAFIKNFASPISRSQLPMASASDITLGIDKLRQLHQQVLPFILRREKSQVLSELPQMSQTIVRVPLSFIQKHMYEDFCAVKSSCSSIDGMEKSLLHSSNPTMGMSADSLKSLLFLRLLCTHPSLVLTKQQLTKCPSIYRSINASGKMLALAELLRTAIQYEDDIMGADNDASLLYCEDDSDDQDTYFNVLSTPDSCLGDMVAFHRESRLTTAARCSKCLIFAQFSRSLDAVEDTVLKALMPSVKYVRLDGAVSPERRMDIVNLFQWDPTVKVLLLTTRVGGIGLNLTSANTVIFLEIDFNPYADFQAQDRCMRIGQTKQVNVYRIVTQDSIEEKILALQSAKIAVTEAIVNTDNSTLYSMGTDRLLDVFTMGSHNDAATSDFGLKLEYDLEGIVEQCSIDYRNLSVDQFAKAFDGLPFSEIPGHIDAQNEERTD